MQKLCSIFCFDQWPVLLSNCADMKPSMAQLTRIKGSKVEVLKAIAPFWKKLGFLMDLDPKGRKVARIEAENSYT